MTSLAGLLQEVFHKHLENHFSQSGESDPFYKVRAKSWEHFLLTGLPSRNMEVFRYIKLRKLYAQEFSKSAKKEYDNELIQKEILPECKNSVAVLVNGEFRPDLSSLDALTGKAFILPMHQALRTYGTFLNNHLTKSLKVEKDPFVALNGALNMDGVFFYVPPKTILERPIQIINIIDAGDSAVFASPRVHFFVGSQSQANVTVLNKCFSGKRYFCNQMIDFVLEEASQVSLDQIFLGLPNFSWTFDAVRASLKRDSSFRSLMITDGAETVRSDYHIQLTGENSEVSLNGLWMLNESREAHMNILIDHQAPHCRSKQLFKGILDDNSNSSFEGKIYVRAEAQKTDAFQLNNNLLLSDHAHAQSKPNLEIFADDVKASHGATVGQLDKEQLFYLQARGYSSDLAKRVLVKGYCQELINQLNIGSLKEVINAKFDHRSCI